MFILEENKRLEFTDIDYIHEDKVKEIKSIIPDEEVFYDLADFFKVFGDSSRVKILFALEVGEMCVNDIAASLGMTQSAVSHQLRVLRQNDLVKFRKDGKVTYYSLDDNHVLTVLQQGYSHISHKH